MDAPLVNSGTFLVERSVDEMTSQPQYGGRFCSFVSCEKSTD